MVEWGVVPPSYVKYDQFYAACMSIFKQTPPDSDVFFWHVE